MINIHTEQLLTFAEAAREFPGQPALSQIYRWSLSGLKGIRLEWLKCGGKRFTSKEAIARFCYRLTAADGGEVALTPTKARQRQQQAAFDELEADGLPCGAPAGE